MNRFSTHECSTHRMWLRTPPTVVSGEEVSGADRVSSSLSPRHLSMAVSRVYWSMVNRVDRSSQESGRSVRVTLSSLTERLDHSYGALQGRRRAQRSSSSVDVTSTHEVEPVVASGVRRSRGGAGCGTGRLASTSAGRAVCPSQASRGPTQNTVGSADSAAARVASVDRGVGGQYRPDEPGLRGSRPR